MSRRVSLPARVAWFSLAIVFVLAAASIAPGASGQSMTGDQAAEVQPTGTGRITITLVAADNGSPVKRTHVMLMGSAQLPAPVNTQSSPVRPIMPPRVQRDGETDETGRVEFGALPAGSYSLAFMALSGFVRSNRPETFRLGEGEAVQRTIRLDRTGAISGHIFDETGDPLARASMRVIRRVTGIGGTRYISAGSSAFTDDRGEFRIFDLSPGDYLVQAAPRRPFSGAIEAAAPSEGRTGYLPTYYPGTAAMDGARVVTVGKGQDAVNVDFSVLRGKLGRINGYVTGADGRPISSQMASVMVGLKSEVGGGSSYSGSAIKPDGSFVCPDVPPGQYYVVAQRSLGADPRADREAAFTVVTVNGDEVVANLQTNKGATLRGRIVREGAAPAPPGPADARLLAAFAQSQRVMVSAVPVPGSGNLPMTSAPGGRPTQVDEDGRFELTGIRGEVQLIVGTGTAALKSIRSGIRDLTLGPLELSGTERIDDIEIVLTTETGFLRGAVTDARGEPVNGAQVIVFPEESRQWYPLSPFVHQTMSLSGPAPGSISSSSLVAVSPAGSALGTAPMTRVGPAPGAFMMSRLLPGRYYAVAIERDSGLSPSLFDGDLLGNLRKHAASVLIEAGKTTIADLKIVR